MNVFTYGSLMFERIYEQVTHSLPLRQQATLKNWRRHAIVGKPYPAAVPEAGSTIEGVVWLGVTQTELQLLDRFESFEYQREEVTVVTAEGKAVSAQIYRWLDVSSRDAEDWNPDVFAAAHASDFYQIHQSSLER